MLARTLDDFHHWLPAAKLPFAPAILLDPTQGLPETLAESVAEHLNEFDENSEGRWIAFAPELIEAIQSSAAQLALLGVDESLSGEALTCAVYEALARRGRVVLNGPLAAKAAESLATVFRAGMAGAPKDIGELHLLLNVERFHDCYFPGLIGDTYLEWQAAWSRAATV